MLLSTIYRVPNNFYVIKKQSKITNFFQTTLFHYHYTSTLNKCIILIIKMFFFLLSVNLLVKDNRGSTVLYFCIYIMKFLSFLIVKKIS